MADNETQTEPQLPLLVRLGIGGVIVGTIYTAAVVSYAGYRAVQWLVRIARKRTRAA